MKKSITLDEAKEFVHNRTSYDGRFIMDYTDSYKALDVFHFLLEQAQRQEDSMKAWKDPEVK